jgi:hypothetical protein
MRLQTNILLSALLFAGIGSVAHASPERYNDAPNQIVGVWNGHYQIGGSTVSVHAPLEFLKQLA